MNSKNQLTFKHKNGVDILITLPLNVVTTLRMKNLRKQINKAMIIIATQERKETVKLNRKIDKDEEYPAKVESRNQHKRKKKKLKLRKFNYKSKI